MLDSAELEADLATDCSEISYALAPPALSPPEDASCELEESADDFASPDCEASLPTEV